MPSTKTQQHQKIYFIPELKLKIFQPEYFHLLSADFYWLQTQTSPRTTVTLYSKGLGRSRPRNTSNTKTRCCSPGQVFASITVKTVTEEGVRPLCFIQLQKTFQRFYQALEASNSLGTSEPPLGQVSQFRGLCRDAHTLFMPSVRHDHKQNQGNAVNASTKQNQLKQSLTNKNTTKTHNSMWGFGANQNQLACTSSSHSVFNH